MKRGSQSIGVKCSILSSFVSDIWYPLASFGVRACLYYESFFVSLNINYVGINVKS